MDAPLHVMPFAVTADDVGDPPGSGRAKVTGVGTGRFLFIDVAAMRAKQLRAGARPRISAEAVGPHKLEWVAMEEVRRGLVSYETAMPFAVKASDLRVV